MLKRVISFLLVGMMIFSISIAFEVNAEENEVLYEMNSLEEAQLAEDGYARTKELVSGVFGRSKSDTSMKISMDTANGHRPAKEDNRGLVRFNINKTVPVGGVIDASFYMASEYVLSTNLSVIGYNSKGEEAALGASAGSCAIGRTICLDANAAAFVFFRGNDKNFSRSDKLHIEKNRWYKYTVRIVRTSEENIKFECYIDNRLGVRKEDIKTAEVNASLDKFTGIAALQFGHAFWDADLNKGIIPTYFDDVKANVYESAAAAPVIEGASFSNSGLNFYTPPRKENYSDVPYSFSTAMFVTEKTTIADVKKDFLFNNKTWEECNAIVRNAEGETITDETLPIAGNYLVCKDDNGEVYYLNPFTENIPLTVKVNQIKNEKGTVYRILENQSAHGRDGLLVFDQFYTRNECIKENNMDAVAADALKNYLLDDGVAYNPDRAQAIDSRYFPVTVSGDFYADLTGNTKFIITTKFVSEETGGNVFWTPRPISANDNALHMYNPFYPTAWNKIAVTVYPGTKYADLYLNGVFVRRYEAPSTIREMASIKVLVETSKNDNDSKGTLYIDNFKVEAGIYQLPEVTADDIFCVTTDYAQFLNVARLMKLKKTITKADLPKAIGNLDEIDGYGLFTDNARTEITDDDYVIQQNDTLLIKKKGIWKYYRISYGVSIAIGKIAMAQENGEITDAMFEPGKLDVSMPVVYADAEHQPNMIIASYNQERLVGVKINSAQENVVTGSVITGDAEIPADADSVVIMLLESMESINPLMSCIRLTKRN